MLQCLYQRDGSPAPGAHPGPPRLCITITKASLDYEGTPWLSYDSHFRRVAAAAKLTDWSQVDASLWTLYFTSARLSHGSLGGPGCHLLTAEGGRHAEKEGGHTKRTGSHPAAAGTPRTHPACRYAKTGTTGVAQKPRAGSDTCALSVTPRATPAGSAPMVGKPVPVSNAQRPRGSPFSTTAQKRAVSAEPETDSYSVGEELLVDLNTFGQDVPGDCNFVGLPSEVECMNSVGVNQPESGGGN